MAVLRRCFLPLLAIILTAPAVRAQRTPAPAVVFESSPTLNASVILQPEYYQGMYFQVRDPVPTYAGANTYTIDSDFGVFIAEGNQMLMRRIREINAIARLRAVSRTDAFGKAAKKAAESPLVAAQDLITKPVSTISGVPRGLWRLINRTGQSIKEATEGRKPDPAEGGMAANIIGFSKAKRDLALKLGVDPYSTNEVFQKELNSVAWPVFAGGFTVDLGMAAVTGGAGVALSAANWTSTLNDALRDNDPADLRLMNLKKLLDMGVPRPDAVPFLNNNAFSPATQTILIAALEQLDQVRSRDAFVRLACAAEDEHEALYFQQSAQLMARLNTAAPISRITEIKGLPVCQTNDGTVVVPLQWDYVAWTPMAERFVNSVKAAKFDTPATGYFIMITGVFSPATAQALTTRGIRFSEKQLPNPLN
jgi:hypothetical protein